jgi:hypothetical protein
LIREDVPRTNRPDVPRSARVTAELREVLAIGVDGVYRQVFLFGAIAEKRIGCCRDTHGFRPPERTRQGTPAYIRRLLVV